MYIQSLENTSMDQITQCFNQAFANYFVPFNATPAYLKRRWQATGVDLSLSFGVFEGQQLGGFIINAIDQWRGHLSAFNAATGVIPEFRGQRLVKKMYEKAIPRLQNTGVKQICLEVICENEKAIKAYQSVGMKIGRRLRCFAGEISISGAIQAKVKVEKQMIAQWEVYQTFWDFEPSWEQFNPCVERAREAYTIYELHQDEQCLGYAIINPQNGSIRQFAIHPDHRRRGLGKLLFYHLSKVRPKLSLNNIDDRSEATCTFLEQLGFDNPINQYEMSGRINGS